MASKFLNKKNKKIIIILILIIAIIAIMAGFKIYQNKNSKIYSGEGIYYYQQDNNKTLQFDKDKNFSYSVKFDENSSDVLKGTWAQNGNEITLTYEGGETFTFVKTSDGFIYRKDKVFRGKTSDKKLLNNIYALEKDGKAVEKLCFMDDGTVELVEGINITSRGTYTRVGNILIVRRLSAPDSYNKRVEIVERYLVLDNGITKELYAKTPAENVAK